MKRVVAIIVVILGFVVEGWGQEVLGYHDPDTVINFEQAVKTLKDLQDESEREKNRIDSLSEMYQKILDKLASQEEETLSVQQDLYRTNSERIKDALSNAKNKKQQVAGYRTLLGISHSGTVISGISSPASSDLGVKYSDVMLKNAQETLGNSLSGKSKRSFLLTIERIVKLPLIDDVLNSNPISSLASNIFQYAVGYNNNKIPEDKFKEFADKIAPYEGFYQDIYKTTNEYEAEIIFFKTELKETQHGLDNYLSKIYFALNTK